MEKGRIVVLVIIGKDDRFGLGFLWRLEIFERVVLGFDTIELWIYGIFWIEVDGIVDKWVEMVEIFIVRVVRIY